MNDNSILQINDDIIAITTFNITYNQYDNLCYNEIQLNVPNVNNTFENDFNKISNNIIIKLSLIELNSIDKSTFEKLLNIITGFSFDDSGLYKKIKSEYQMYVDLDEINNIHTKRVCENSWSDYILLIPILDSHKNSLSRIETKLNDIISEIKRKELEKEAELKRKEELENANELKRIEELEEAELKRKEELEKANELKRIEELKKADELKKQAELKRKEELKKAKLKRKEELENANELKKQITETVRIEIEEASKLNKNASKDLKKISKTITKYKWLNINDRKQEIVTKELFKGLKSNNFIKNHTTKNEAIFIETINHDKLIWEKTIKSNLYLIYKLEQYLEPISNRHVVFCSSFKKNEVDFNIKSVTTTFKRLKSDLEDGTIPKNGELTKIDKLISEFLIFYNSHKIS